MIKISNGERETFFEYSKIGAYHVKRNLENQDSIGYGSYGDTFWIAVADGVSACPYSKKGSLVAIDTIKELAEEISEGNIRLWDENGIRQYVVSTWKNKIGSNWNAYGTTLNFVIVRNKNVLLGQIGDGLILIRTNEQEQIFSKQAGFYTPKTYALGEVVYKKSFQIYTWENVSSLKCMIMTDGIGNEIDTECCSDFISYFSHLLSKPYQEVENEIENWVEFLEKKNEDDKTIGILILEDIR